MQAAGVPQILDFQTWFFLRWNENASTPDCGEDSGILGCGGALNMLWRRNITGDGDWQRWTFESCLMNNQSAIPAKAPECAARARIDATAPLAARGSDGEALLRESAEDRGGAGRFYALADCRREDGNPARLPEARLRCLRWTPRALRLSAVNAPRCGMTVPALRRGRRPETQDCGLGELADASPSFLSPRHGGLDTLGCWWYPHGQSSRRARAPTPGRVWATNPMLRHVDTRRRSA